MGKVEAKVFCTLGALTCALTVSCGDNRDDTPGADEADEDVRFTSAEVSSEGAAALETTRCPAYRDDTELTETSITIKNARVSPIYLVRQRAEEACHVPAFFAVTHAGVRLNVEGFAGCAPRSCQQLQDGADEDRAELEHADAELLTRLEPGASLAVGVLDAEYVSHGLLAATPRMPARCIAQDERDGDVACVSKRALASGLYRVSARAFASLECDGERSCECARTAVGWCMLDRAHRSRGPALEAALELELPAERATLTFSDTLSRTSP